MQRFINPLILIFLVMTLASCNVSRRVERRGGNLLVKNVIKTDRPGIIKSDILNFTQPKPNKKFLGLFRSRVWVWDAFAHNSKHRFSRWMVRNFAESPVLLDTIAVHNSLIPMKQYLSNKGYFGAGMKSSVEVKRGRAKVFYTTVTKEPFKFGKISREINDDTLKKIVLGEGSYSLLKEGDQYDAYNMTAERDRITQLLRNSGYYAFNSDYIFYEVDTTATHGVANIKLIIKNRNNDVMPQTNAAGESATGAATENGQLHKRYVFNQIFINSDYPRSGDTLRNFDTISFYGNKPSDSTLVPDFYELYRNSIRLRPEAIARSVYIKPGEYYSQKNINLTYNRIQNMGISSYVSVNVRPPTDTLVKIGSNQQLLDCDIRIVRAKVNSFTIEAEGTNTEGMMGLGSSINYLNRNVFEGAEALRVKTFGSFEIRPSLTEDKQNKLLAIFNSLAAGFETGLDFPTLLSPFPFKLQYQNARPRTSLGVGFNYELRNEYERYLAKFSLSYEWNSTAQSRHYLSPVDLSSISIVRTDLFTQTLLNLKDPRFFNQYTNHLILALKYSYIFNNQNLTERKNFIYFRINFEPAGNLFNLFSSITAAPKDEEGKYKLFGLRYAQYFRTDFDFRYYKPVTLHQRLVYRGAFGIGIPYGNSISLPFEKGFFAGGANGMRGWPVRSLGPGEYYQKDANVLENVGDLSFEGNVEYRFPLYRFLNGAIFTDVGNIWLLQENSDFPGGNFKWNRALQSLAWDAGMGLRFDFSIFIFRIDGGLRIYDPALPVGDRMFLPTKFRLKDINWNFGIGYPF